MAVRLAPVEFGLLVSDAQALTDRVWTGMIHTTTVGQRKAFIKVLPPRKLLVELLAAVVGRAHDLPIPEPFLITVQGHQLQKFPKPEARFWAFASLDSESPSLSRLTRDPAVAAQHLRRWKRVSEAVAFDSWLANPDRTTKNILLSDNGEHVALIDHEDALAEWMTPEQECANELMLLLCQEADEFTRNRHLRNAQKAGLDYPKTPLAEIRDSCHWALHFTTLEEVERLVGFLTARIQHLPNLLSAAAGVKQYTLRYAYRP
jgi:hypothetical protein